MDSMNTFMRDFDDPEILESLRIRVRDSLTKSYKAGYEKGFENGQLEQQLHDTNLYDQSDFDAVKKQAYAQGVKDVWAVARRILNNNPADDLESLFNTESLGWIVKNYDVEEVLTKLNGKDILVGDEVQSNYSGGQKYVVTCVINDGEILCTFDGSRIKATDVHKTGRHFDQIEDLIQQI